jgi:hypothetical protein
MPVKTRYWLYDQSQSAGVAIFHQEGNREVLTLSRGSETPGRLPADTATHPFRVPPVDYRGHYQEVTKSMVETVSKMINHGIWESGMINGTLHLVQFHPTRWGDTDIDWTIGAAYTMNRLTPQFKGDEVANPGFDPDWVLSLLGHPIPELKPVLYPTRFERILGDL